MRSERIQYMNDIASMFSTSGFVYLISYKGLAVADFTELRKALAGTDAECHVLKNTFIKKAAESLEMGELASYELTGDTAVVVGAGDCCATAKIVKKFAKTNEAVAFKVGYLDGALLSSTQIEQLAELPPKEVLQAKLLGTLQAVPRNLVGVLSQKLSTIVYVLKAALDQKQG